MASPLTRRPTEAGIATASALAVCASAIGILLATGVSARDVVLLVGFQLGFVVVPGVAVYRALSRRPGGVLRHLSVGWGVGYSLSILAFAATAAVGIRDAFLVSRCSL